MKMIFLWRHAYGPKKTHFFCFQAKTHELVNLVRFENNANRAKFAFPWTRDRGVF